MSVYIIAEAGVNHNGSFALACKLVDAAKEAGADCIKFQTFKSENLVSRSAKKAEYQKMTTGDSSQQDMLKKLELSFDEFIQLKDYCEKVGICFLSTPFDLDSIDFLNSIDMPFWKIPSGEVTNLPYLLALAKTGKPVVMSTGMCTLQEIRAAIDVLQANGTTEIKLLHCNTEYPTPFEDVNLKAMQTMRDEFHLEVGYSDHTKGIEVPIAAVALGATIIEKHFTLDRNMEGPDHKASLEPQELAEMVCCIRNIEKALGKVSYELSDKMKSNRDFSRSLFVVEDMEKGEIITENNVRSIRPGYGLHPKYLKDILGKRVNKNLKKGMLFDLSFIDK